MERASRSRRRWDRNSSPGAARQPGTGLFAAGTARWFAAGRVPERCGRPRPTGLGASSIGTTTPTATSAAGGTTAAPTADGASARNAQPRRRLWLCLIRQSQQASQASSRLSPPQLLGYDFTSH